MNGFYNADGQPVVEGMIASIQSNKEYLGEIDGLIGNGDHGMNMNKGFSMAQKELNGQKKSFTECLEILGSTLFNDIGGSMGPIYGTIFMDMSDAGANSEIIDLSVFSGMLRAGLSGLQEIVDAQVGDKTLVDTLSPACDALKKAAADEKDFSAALQDMKRAAETGKDSTENLVAKFGRSARLGERSRGVLDAGATSCNLILQAMADGIAALL